MDPIVNKVASSGLITIDLEEMVAGDMDRKVIDLADFLFQGMILREKDFRLAVSEMDLAEFEGSWVAIQCSADAIIPTWAYMLIGSRLQQVAERVVFGNEDDLVSKMVSEKIAALDAEVYRDAKVVIKGCGDINIPESCYLEITTKLSPVVSSLMFGEPCSTVPILKNRKKKQREA